MTETTVLFDLCVIAVIRTDIHSVYVLCSCPHYMGLGLGVGFGHLWTTMSLYVNPGQTSHKLNVLSTVTVELRYRQLATCLFTILVVWRLSSMLVQSLVSDLTLQRSSSLTMTVSYSRSTFSLNCVVTN